MLESANSVVVLLTSEFSRRLMVLELDGARSDNAVVSPESAMILKSGISVTGIHCIETGEDLRLDEDYAVFLTERPGEFLEHFVPALRSAVERLGWPQVRTSLRNYLTSRG